MKLVELSKVCGFLDKSTCSISFWSSKDLKCVGSTEITTMGVAVFEYGHFPVHCLHNSSVAAFDKVDYSITLKLD